jgi:hypothetical protein
MDIRFQLVLVVMAFSAVSRCRCSVLMLCNSSSPQVIYGRENGTIVSSNYPNFIPARVGTSHPCSLTITACPTCRIRLSFDDLWTHWMPLCLASAASQGGCIAGCDHLYLYELGNEESTFMYITPSNIPSNSTFVTQTRMLFIRYCQAKETNDQQKKFAINYEVIEKSETFHGRSTESGQFTSLGFPQMYSSNGDVFVYHLHNDDRQGYIRLSFDDWDMSPYSSVVIYRDGNRSGVSSSNVNIVRVTGAAARPFVTSVGSDMAVEFHTATIILTLSTICGLFRDRISLLLHLES